MKIGFDAKRAFNNTSGLGNYSRAVIQSMSENFSEENFFLFSPSEKNKTGFSVPANCELILPNGISKSLWRSYGMLNEWNKLQLNIYHGLSNELPFGLNRSKAKKIVTIHDVIFKTHPEFYSVIDRTIYEIKTRHSVANADCIVAVSRQTKNELMKFYRVESEKIKVIYQSVPAHIISTVSSAEKDLVKKKYSLPDNFLLHTGTIERRKNLLTVLKALTRIKNPPALVVCGRETPYLKELKTFLENKKNISVQFIHNSSNIELNSIYSLAYAFIYASLHEGFGIPITEAATHALPVITSADSAMAEAAGDAGILVNPKDEEQIAAAIENLFSDSTLRNKLSDASLMQSRKFLAKNSALELMNLYREIC